MTSDRITIDDAIRVVREVGEVLRVDINDEMAERILWHDTGWLRFRPGGLEWRGAIACQVIGFFRSDNGGEQ